MSSRGIFLIVVMAGLVACDPDSPSGGATLPEFPAQSGSVPGVPPSSSPENGSSATGTAGGSSATEAGGAGAGSPTGPGTLAETGPEPELAAKPDPGTGPEPEPAVEPEPTPPTGTGLCSQPGFDTCDQNEDGTADQCDTDAVWVGNVIDGTAPKGSFLNPYAKVGEAVESEKANQSKRVFLKFGIYQEDKSILLKGGMSLYGGYNHFSQQLFCLSQQSVIKTPPHLLSPVIFVDNSGEAKVASTIRNIRVESPVKYMGSGTVVRVNGSLHVVKSQLIAHDVPAQTVTGLELVPILKTISVWVEDSTISMGDPGGKASKVVAIDAKEPGNNGNYVLTVENSQVQAVGGQVITGLRLQGSGENEATIRGNTIVAGGKDMATFTGTAVWGILVAPKMKDVRLERNSIYVQAKTHAFGIKAQDLQSAISVVGNGLRVAVSPVPGEGIVVHGISLYDNPKAEVLLNTLRLSQAPVVRAVLSSNTGNSSFINNIVGWTAPQSNANDNLAFEITGNSAEKTGTFHSNLIMPGFVLAKVSGGAAGNQTVNIAENLQNALGSTTWTVGNILHKNNPLFDGEEFKISTSSPAKDQGLHVTGPGVGVDLYGNPRPQGKGFDIGAHEVK